MVTHRIGGLESHVFELDKIKLVTHRIGGLETPAHRIVVNPCVTHRIGGLEIRTIYDILKSGSYTPHRWLRNYISPLA